MKTAPFLLAANVFAAFILLADDVAVANSNTLTASLDTAGSPHAITSLAEAVSLVCRPGSTVTATDADSGETRTLTVSAAGSASWTPTAGGLWVLNNSVDGHASFTVRYSLFGTQGLGTESDPFKIVDSEEFSDMVEAGTVTGGSYLAFRGADGLIGAISMPTGHAFREQGNGVVRFDAVSDGLVYGGTPVVTFIDAKTDGPSRVMKRRREVRHISYSGDGWLRDGTATATLTIVSPSGVASARTVTGTGTIDFLPHENGLWAITLASGAGTLSSVVSVSPIGGVLSFR